MSKSYIWLVQLINFLLYLSLQVAILQRMLPFYNPTCFVYIGYFLFLPWRKSNLIVQLIVGFLIGLTVDAFYNSLGIHAFAAVLVIYIRNYLLYILPPYAPNDNEYATRPTLANMGVKKYSVYSIILLFIYHTSVLYLHLWNNTFFFNTIPELFLSIILSYLLIFVPQFIFTVLVGNTHIR